MNRRDFIGSVIGTLAGINLNFLALRDTAPWQRVILPYRMIYNTHSGRIQAPGITEIQRVHAGLLRRDSFVFKVEPLLITQTMKIESGILLTEHGQIVSEFDFIPGISVWTGDELKVTYSITGVPPEVTLQEAVEFVIRLRLINSR